MTVLAVTHRTVYRYTCPVAFGPHRLMFRPRDSHDLRLLDTALFLTPPAQVHWLHDIFGNSIAVAEFRENGTELVLESSFRAKHYPLAAHQISIEPYAERYPFSYSADEAADLGRTAERHYPDPGPEIDLWTRQFVDAGHAARPIDRPLRRRRDEGSRRRWRFGRRRHLFRKQRRFGRDRPDGHVLDHGQDRGCDRRLGGGFNRLGCRR